MQRKKNLGTAVALIILFGPFGFVYLGWKSFLAAIAGMIIIGIIVANQADVVIFLSLVIFEILLLIIIWARYRKREKFFESAEVSEEINGQAPEYKKCPFCGEQILQIARKCKYCGEFLDRKAVSFSAKKKSYGILTVALLAVIVFLGYTFRYTILFYSGTRIEFNNAELSYIDPVTKSEAQDLGEFLVKQGSPPATLLITKTYTTYEVRMVTKKGIENLDGVFQEGYTLAHQISETVFDGKPVDIHLCDELLRTKVVIPCSSQK